MGWYIGGVILLIAASTWIGARCGQWACDKTLPYRAARYWKREQKT